MKKLLLSLLVAGMLLVGMAACAGRPVTVTLVFDGSESVDYLKVNDDVNYFMLGT